MGETPFSLAFSVEVVTPLEINICLFETKTYKEEENEQSLRAKLDLLEEKRNGAKLINAIYK